MRRLLTGYEALEGAILDECGSLLFSDLRGGGVRVLDPDGEVRVVVPDRRGVGGLCLHADGGLVLSGADLSHVNGKRRRILLALDDLAATPGTTAVAFNDIAADPDGRVLAGVLREDEQGQPAPGELVLVTGEHEHVVLLEGLHPNGIGFSPDRALIHVCDTFGRRFVTFSRSQPDRARDISTAAVDGYPDGLAVDADGCIWIAFYRGGCVARFDPEGMLLQVVPVPALKPLTVCLTLPHTAPALFIVTATREPGSAETGSVYSMPVDVGAGPHDRARI